MTTKQYIPQRGELVLVSDFDLTDKSSFRVFSHMSNGKYMCFNNSFTTKSFISSINCDTTDWNLCKRYKGEFHKDFKPVLIENKPLKLYL